MDEFTATTRITSIALILEFHFSNIDEAVATVFGGSSVNINKNNNRFVRYCDKL